MIFEDKNGSNFLPLAFPLFVIVAVVFVIFLWNAANFSLSVLRRMGPDVVDDENDVPAEEVPLLPGGGSGNRRNGECETGMIVDPPPRSDGRAKHLISLVIPAYNEEARLPPMLDDTLGYLRDNRKRLHEILSDLFPGTDADDQGELPSFEIIVVDDGSTDRTREVVERRAARAAVAARKDDGSGPRDVVRLINMRRNGGKGAAVRTGMLAADGDLCLMLDADGATDVRDLTRLATAIAEAAPASRSNRRAPTWPSPPIVAIGSRAHLEDRAIAERSPVRTFLMHAFHFFVRRLCSERVRDTQCGFKLFTREAAWTLFSGLHLKRWAFDVELVVMAELLEIPLLEVGVNWREVEGSKLDATKFALALNSLSMLRDMLFVRLCYATGIWTVRSRRRSP